MGCPCESCGPHVPPPDKTGCKVAMLHSTCICSVASHSCCQITPFTQPCIMSSGILAPPPILIWPPRWPPQTRNAGHAAAFSCCTDCSFVTKTFLLFICQILYIYWCYIWQESEKFYGPRCCVVISRPRQHSSSVSVSTLEIWVPTSQP